MKWFFKSVRNRSSDVSEKMLYNARSRLVNISLIILLVVGYLVLFTYIPRILEIGWQPVSIIHFFILVTGTIVVFLRKKLSMVFRGTVLLLMTLLSSFGALASFGIVGSGFFGMGMMGCTIASLTFGRRVGLSVVLFSTAYYFLVYYLYFSGILKFHVPSSSYVDMKVAWIAAFSGYSFPVLILIFGIDEMHKILKSFILAILSNNERIKTQVKFRGDIFNTSDSLIFLLDENLNISEMNFSAGRASGFMFDEISGRSFVDVFFPLLKRDEISAIFEEGISSSSVQRREDQWNSKHGVILVNWTAKLVHLDRMTSRKWLINGINMTEFRSLERKFYQAQKMESIGNLAGGIAHDFNNMLTGIICSAENLRTNVPDNEDNKEYLDMIVSTGQRAAGLTKKLLSFARMENGPQEILEINNSIDDAINLIASGRRSGVRIEKNLSASSLFMKGEASYLINAFLNLGINACDAMPDGGVLTFESAAFFADEEFCIKNGNELLPGKYAKITVCDTGVGIPEEKLERIFEPFYTTKGRDKGTGLGLSSVYGTIKKAGGIIRVQSSLGSGTVFSILLPVMDSKIAGIPERNSSVFKASGLRLLVVDDEESIRNGISSYLSSMGHFADSAENGKDALLKIASSERKYDIVILDWLMPVMNGSEAMSRILEVELNTGIIITSGFGIDHKSLEIPFRTGRVRYLSKPYSNNDLEDTINELYSEISPT